MSRTARRATAILCLAAAAVLPPLWFGSAAARLAELHVRSPRLDVHMGSLTSAQPLGQGFRCATDGLWRIDVRMLATEPRHLAVPIELVLRADAPDGPALRRATFDPDRTPDRLRGSWISFEFQPLTDSAGRAYWFELVPGAEAAHHYSGPWVRYRAQTGERRGWGDGVADGDRAEARFTSPLPDLSAVAVAVEHADADARIALTLVDVATDEVVRRVEQEPGELRRGWLPFAFEPLAEAYARVYRVEVGVEGSAALRTEGGELAFRSLHGRHAADPDLLGMTRGGEPLDDRDLFLRTFTTPGAAAIEHRLVHRAGARVVVAGLAWVGALALTALLVARALAGRPGERA
jgi:hypothetical protein